jgi:hypothetical protein
MWWIIILVQTIFYIVHDEHMFVSLFILLSLGFRVFSNNPLIYLLAPSLITHSIYILQMSKTTIHEGLSKKAKRRARKAKKKAKKKGNQAAQGAKTGATTAAQGATSLAPPPNEKQAGPEPPPEAEEPPSCEENVELSINTKQDACKNQ